MHLYSNFTSQECPRCQKETGKKKDSKHSDVKSGCQICLSYSEPQTRRVWSPEHPPGVRKQVWEGRSVTTESLFLLGSCGRAKRGQNRPPRQDLVWCVTGLLSQSSGSIGSGLSPGDQLGELVEAAGPVSGSPPPSPGCFPPLTVLTGGAHVPKCHTPASPTGIADCHCQRLLPGTSGGREGCIFTAPASRSLSPETRAPYPPWALLFGAMVRKT